MKIRKNIILCLVFLLFFLVGFTNKIQAKSFNKEKDQVFISGESLGIEIQLGVKIEGTYGISSNGKILTPWKDAKLKEGDVILSYDGITIESLSDLQNALNLKKDKISELVYLRNSKKYVTSIQPAQKKNGVYSLGIYVKDKISGIGTLTFVIPDTYEYGALGHSIEIDSFTGGSVYSSKVTSIIKGNPTMVGSKKASFVKYIGTLEKNEITGIYGTLSSIKDLEPMSLYSIATKEEVHTGTAYLLTSLEDSKIGCYEIEITSKASQSKLDIKSMKIRVTDEELIRKTGGIVQGMSGSPIIQDGKLIGAVTHVLVGNPTEGYGIYIEWMLKSMGINII